MKKEIKEIAEKSGFILWEDENWKPENQIIDWSTDYDKELDKFTELILKKCLKCVEIGKNKSEIKELIISSFDLSKKNVVKKKKSVKKIIK